MVGWLARPMAGRLAGWLAESLDCGPAGWRLHCWLACLACRQTGALALPRPPSPTPPRLTRLPALWPPLLRQNFFRAYPKLAGMTGTAATESAEFSQVGIRSTF